VPRICKGLVIGNRMPSSRSRPVQVKRGGHVYQTKSWKELREDRWVPGYEIQPRSRGRASCHLACIPRQRAQETRSSELSGGVCAGKQLRVYRRASPSLPAGSRISFQIHTRPTATHAYQIDRLLLPRERAVEGAVASLAKASQHSRRRDHVETPNLIPSI